MTVTPYSMSTSPGVLEELQLFSPDEEHVYWLQFMPVLRRLDIWCHVGGPLDELQVVVPPLRWPSLIRWMRLCGPPRVTCVSPSLETLWLFVGTTSSAESPAKLWPWACNDLGPMLRDCAMVSLKRLILQRHQDHEYYYDEVGRCRWQLAAVRRALPGVEVKCNFCDNVPMEHF